MLDLYVNIKNRRKELGLTQTELAEKLGYADKSMIAKIEKGSVDLSQSRIVSFAEALETTPAALMGWATTDSDTILSSFSNIHPLSKSSLPVLGSVACGKPMFIDEHLEFYVDAIESIRADFILIAKGDSMIGARIHDGDLVFIRQQPEVENGEIAAVAIKDEATLKRVYRYANNSLLVLRAENPSFEDLEFSGEELEDVRILGKAVAFQSYVR